MEISVRYIPTDHIVVDGKVKASGNKPALCFIGTDYAQCIVNNDEMVEVVTISVEEAQNSRLVPLNGSDKYPISTYMLHASKWDKPFTSEAEELIRMAEDPPKDLPKKKTSSTAPTRKRKRVSTASIINVLAEEHELPPTKIRKFLRSQGMHAPYDDEKGIRTAMKSFGKPKPKQGSKSHGKTKAKGKGKRK